MRILILILLLSSPIVAQESYSPETAFVNFPAPDPQFGSSWENYDGLTVWDHLSLDHHRGNIIGDYRALTLSQAKDLHSDLHNTGRTLNAADYGSVSVATQYSYSPEVFVAAIGASNCPNGQCPVRVAPVRRVANAAQSTVMRSVHRTRRFVLRARGRLFPRLRAWRSRRLRR